jgi:uncharacterized membrane protein
MRIEIVLVILGMALVTYLTRAGGLWLMGRVGRSRRVEAWMRHVPGAVLVALVAPAVFSEGVPPAVATLATAGVMVYTRNMLLAMVVGIGVVAALRMLS